MQTLLCVGQTRFLLSTEHKQLGSLTRRRYQNFTGDVQSRPDETITVDVIPDKAIPDHLRGQDRIRSVDGKLEIIRGNGYAIWDRQKQACHIKQSCNDFTPDAHYADYLLDSVVRIMLSYHLLEQHGCLIHATGLIRKGKGYLFVGKSGAGKSTVARISAPTADILSDDLPLMQFVRGEAWVFGTPFWGEFRHGRENNLNAPLRGIYFLQQADYNQLTTLTSGRAFIRLMASVMHFGQDKTSTDQILSIVTKLCREVPCYRLEFLSNESFWELIDG